MLYPRLSLCREERMTRCATSQRLRAIVAKRAGMLSVMSPNNSTARSAPRRRMPMKLQYGVPRHVWRAGKTLLEGTGYPAERKEGQTWFCERSWKEEVGG